MSQYGVAALANGTTISCELRLVLTHLIASEKYVLFDTLHKFFNCVTHVNACMAGECLTQST